MKAITLFLFIILFSSFVSAQENMIVFFKDKNGQELANNPFTERSLKRRQKNNAEFDFYDIGVSSVYLNELSQSGVVLNKSRWLNAVSFRSDVTAEELLNTYDFIDRIKQTGSTSLPTRDKFEAFSGTKSLDYGPTLLQTEQINVDCLHDYGYTGEGIYMAIIDAGFNNMDSIPFFDSVYLENRVLDKYNFVDQNDSVYQYSGHGTAVSSCIVGEKGGTEPFLGTAFDVDVALYLSEDVFSETEIEEFNLVAALERSDSVGVDVANISLGYFHFDDSTTSHVYADLDGATTIAAQGVNIAVSKGILVVSSAGNSGPEKISTPGDADEVLCVGAVDWSGDYAFFSSVGPAYDGQVKPDVVARGFEAVAVDETGVTTLANGTSLSSPITAGAVACLIQAHPTKTVEDLLNAIRQSASQFNNPDTLIGYGIPDFCIAEGLLWSMGIEENALNKVAVFPNPAQENVFLQWEVASANTSVELINALGQVLQKVETNEDNLILNVQSYASGIYTVRISTERGVETRQLMIKE